MSRNKLSVSEASRLFEVTFKKLRDTYDIVSSSSSTSAGFGNWSLKLTKSKGDKLYWILTFKATTSVGCPYTCDIVRDGLKKLDFELVTYNLTPLGFKAKITLAK